MLQDFPIYEAPQSEIPPQTATYDYGAFRGSETAIVIDNGSSHLRAGWAGDSSPRRMFSFSSIQFDNFIAKFKSKALGDVQLVGNDVYTGNIKSNSKTMFDGGAVTNSGTLEHTLDYVFTKLGIDSDGVYHPVVMTEALCTPLYSRKLTSELLFEGYSVPSAAYGVDSLFSYYANGGSFDAGMVVSSGQYSTSVIPVLGGRGVLEHCQRIPYGGQQMAEYLLKLLQYKYASFPHRVSLDQAQDLVRQHCFVSMDYLSDLRTISTPERLGKFDRVVQFSYPEVSQEKQTQEDMDRLTEKRREQGRKLQEMAARNREKKLEREEATLVELQNLQDAKSLDSKVFSARMREAGFASESELDSAVKASKTIIRRIQNKMQGIEEVEEKTIPTFPLVDIPDAELSADQIKEKRKQRLLKAGWDANERKRKEKEDQKARQEERERHEAERREHDMDGWLAETRTRRVELLEKIRLKLRKKAQLTDRRSRESQMRMKNIASLAAEEAPAKRKRGGGGEDTFGANDDDWGIYREISRDDDSDDDEATALGKLDDLLLTYDPGFVPENPFDEKPFQNTVIYRLAYGSSRAEASDPIVQNQIRLNVERIRVPEVMFQPSIVGLDQAGIVETFGEIMKRFTAEQQRRMVQSTLITGGNTLFANFDERIRQDVRALRPFQSPMSIRMASNPLLDAWRGASKWAAPNVQGETGFRQSLITRQMYEEMGHDYLVEHPMSNRFWKNASE
ncbi:hypothetical protein DFS34DRAFT_699834 [Phlyctochytrium arcticum]|nr:hypothetical protein DFS34DRAFT_699834 [Phlyctochytrium arcticum]